ncbi:MAG TPA: hypothetical protein VFS43_20640 [Polyangiaceae bacterium]|nr:hypothetical protein [Polyangiaceae bacterium]
MASAIGHKLVDTARNRHVTPGGDFFHYEVLADAAQPAGTTVHLVKTDETVVPSLPDALFEHNSRKDATPAWNHFCVIIDCHH